MDLLILKNGSDIIKLNNLRGPDDKEISANFQPYCLYADLEIHHAGFSVNSKIDIEKFCITEFLTNITELHDKNVGDVEFVNSAYDENLKIKFNSYENFSGQIDLEISLNKPSEGAQMKLKMEADQSCLPPLISELEKLCDLFNEELKEELA